MSSMKHTMTPPIRFAAQRGAASLIIVMVLFFTMMLVTAYTNRSLIFEQRTSANQYRSTQAFEAAEAGLQWALALLNGGRVDAACQPSANVALPTFRQRYLVADLTLRAFTPRPNAAPGVPATGLRPGCVRNAAGWACSCPAAGATPLAAPAGAGSFPAFTVEFSQVNLPGTASPRPGTVKITARGCSGVDPRCVPGAAATSDAYAEVSVEAALLRALSTAPAATVTSRGTVPLLGGTRIVNQDLYTNGITVNAAGDIDTDAGAQLLSRAGTPGEDSVIANDATLGAMTRPLFFKTYMGIDETVFITVPGVREVPCSAGADCSAQMANAAALGTGMLHVATDLFLSGDIVLGSPTEPVLLVVDGVLDFTDNVRIYGAVFGNRLTWSGSAGGFVHGAVMLEGTAVNTCCGGAGPSLVYDPEVLTRLNLFTGGFAPIPGSWKDY
jgi:PilX N-terminal